MKQNKPFFDITEYKINADAKFTIALTADLHSMPCDKIIRILAERRPSLIAVAGDLVDGRTKDARNAGSILEIETGSLAFLKQAVKIAPTYYALGNHDAALTDDDLETICSIGVNILDNSYATIQSRLHIGGLTSAVVTASRRLRLEHPEIGFRNGSLFQKIPIAERGKYKELARVPDTVWLDGFEKLEGIKILICHHPEYWALREPMLSRYNLNVVLSGHSHGGQWRIGNQGIFAPGQGFFPKYTAGVHRFRDNHLVVSRGLANTTCVPRINNCCEVVMINI